MFSKYDRHFADSERVRSTKSDSEVPSVISADFQRCDDRKSPTLTLSSLCVTQFSGDWMDGDPEFSLAPTPAFSR
jgi:hypothetical protein